MYHDGWLIAEPHIWDVRRTDVRYTLPAFGSVITRRPYKHNGIPYLLVHRDGVIQSWDLRSGRMNYEQSVQADARCELYESAGVVAVRQRFSLTTAVLLPCTLILSRTSQISQIFDLATGVVLCTVDANLEGGYGRFINVNAIKGADGLWQPRVWDRATPHQVTVIDIGDWTLWRVERDFVIAKKEHPDRVLLWHINLGCGVQFLCPDYLDTETIWFANGAFFLDLEVADVGCMWMLPVLQSEDQVAALLAAPLCTRVPATVPTVTPRTVYRPAHGVAGQTVLQSPLLPPICSVQTREGMRIAVSM